MEIERFKSFLKRFWWIFVIIILSLSVWIVYSQTNKKEDNFKENIFKTYPDCPSDLSGILTYPLMEAKYISALTPLGNINPPGHTSPVDHIYFATQYEGKIPLYAPADSWITEITTISKDNGKGEYIIQGYVVTYTVCDGLVLDFASYTDIIQPLKDEITKLDVNCKYGIVKPEHVGGAEGQCSYRLNYPVKSGEEIGWVQRKMREDGSGYDLPFEIWAANYNKPAPSQTNWEYYNDDRYAHIMCPFDLYTGDLKQQYYDKLGGWESIVNVKEGDKDVKKEVEGHFVPRNGEPMCGRVDQDIVGTIQGVWFGGKPGDEGIEFAGKVIAFVHNNVDVNIGEVSIGGDLTDGKSTVISFEPNHTGTIDREPSEVMPDEKIYCYNAQDWDSTGKILVQLIDNHNIKAEHQQGVCSTSESFIKPFSYER